MTQIKSVCIVFLAVISMTGFVHCTKCYKCTYTPPSDGARPIADSIPYVRSASNALRCIDPNESMGQEAVESSSLYISAGIVTICPGNCAVLTNGEGRIHRDCPDEFALGSSCDDADTSRPEATFGTNARVTCCSGDYCNAASISHPATAGTLLFIIAIAFLQTYFN